MATTSLWHVNGRLTDLVAYVENPEQTERPLREMDDLWAAAGYIQRPEATEGGRYVTAVNCLAQTAVQQMIATKRQFGKDDGIIAYHGYQSFRPGEITPDTCHEIGVALARQLWGDRFQVLVTTHLDKGHLHNHFCLNSVSFVDGKKYNYSKSERRRMMELSDVLCKSYGLSVIEHPHKAPSRPVYLDEKDGKPTRYNVYRKDVEAALEGNCVPQNVERYLRQLGYQTDFTGAHWKIKLPQYQHYTRLDTLNPEWTRENLKQRLAWNPLIVTHGEVTHSPYHTQESIRGYQPHGKPSRLKCLYLFWCYELGILPKHTDYKPTSPLLREDLRKLDQYIAQLNYLIANDIETMDELQTDISRMETSLQALSAQRQALYNQMRRATDERLDALREERDSVSEQIASVRKDLKMAETIATRRRHVQETLDHVIDQERELRAKEKTSTERGIAR